MHVIGAAQTRVTFAVDSPWVEQVKIWDGEAYVVLPGGARRAVCEADVSCSALKVDDTADADALLEAAAEALKAAGHEEKMAARKRRLAECTGTSDVDEGRRLSDGWGPSRDAPSPACRKFPWMPMCTPHSVCTWCMSKEMADALGAAIKDEEERILEGLKQANSGCPFFTVPCRDSAGKLVSCASRWDTCPDHAPRV